MTVLQKYAQQSYLRPNHTMQDVQRSVMALGGLTEIFTDL